MRENTITKPLLSPKALFITMKEEDLSACKNVLVPEN